MPVWLPGLNMVHRIGSSVPVAGEIAQGEGGDLRDGQPFTITGTGFGTKAAQAPRKFDRFESGTAGQPITGWHAVGAGAVHSTAQLRGISTTSCAVPMPGATTANYVQHNFPDGTTQVFVSFWYYVTVTLPTDLEGGWKMFDLRCGGGENQRILVQGNPNVPSGQIAVDNGSPLQYPAEPINTMDIGEEGHFLVFKDTWVHVQVQVGMDSAIDAGDGYFKIWYNGVPMKDSRSAHPYTRWVFRRTGGGANNGTFQDILIGQFKSTSTDITPYLDDVYVDDSWARVELGNHAVYDSCTERHLQPHTAWAPTAITITGNTGGLTGAQTLHVIDSTGAVVLSEAVTVA